MSRKPDSVFIATKVIVYMPEFTYTAVGFLRVLVFPLPKFQCHTLDAIEVLVNCMVSGAQPVGLVLVKEAIGDCALRFVYRSTVSKNNNLFILATLYTIVYSSIFPQPSKYRKGYF